MKISKLSPAEQLAERLKRTKRKGPSGRTRSLVCRLGEMRAKLGLTLREIEEATGVSNALLCHIEHGTDTRLTTAKKIAKFFGCSLEEMWPDTEGTVP